MTASVTPTAAHKTAHSDTNIKETIESILIAFILAFIFRCYVVEAFVIPTGSMAPTLLGAHMQFRCPDCGYRFTAGYNEQDDTFSVPSRAGKTFGVICPNCGMRVPKHVENDPDNGAENPAIRYGDRILVMKYQYLLQPPQRFDVVVFKTPDNRGTPGDYTVNYIKRLVGRPTERLFVAEGDLYVSPDTGKPPAAKDFKIQTKPKSAQDALWRIVFDCDYVPIGLPRSFTDATGATIQEKEWHQPWQSEPGGSGWISSDAAAGVTAREFVFDNDDGSGTLKFHAETNPNIAALTDWLAYDQTSNQRSDDHDTSGTPSYGLRDDVVRNVADLKVQFVLDKFVGAGKFRAIVGKQNDAAFVCEVSNGLIRLIKEMGESRREIGSVPLPSGPVRLTLQNVDYRVSIAINGVERLTTTEADYRPDVAAVIDRAQANQAGPAGYCQIEGDRCHVRMSHLQLWRDVFYRDREPNMFVPRGTAVDFPNRVVQLGKDEYFAMGDNSYQSSDGRYWTSRVDIDDENLHISEGRVPGRFLLGKAFFVYWPAGYRAVDALPPLIPNFGDMRFIR